MMWAADLQIDFLCTLPTGRTGESSRRDCSTIWHFASPIPAVTMHPGNQSSGSSSSNMTGGNMTSNNMTRSGTITGSNSNKSR
jgi:hypothetical protein